MEFKQLEAFASVVRLGSFSRAAEALFLTQPTVSAHVMALERELGVKLVARLAKGAAPTETGKILYEYAQSMLSLRDDAVEKCKNRGGEVCGKVNIAASTVTYQYVLPRVMSLFRQSYPNITFDIQSMDSAGVALAIMSGKAELGMSGAVMNPDSCRYVEFMDDSLVVIAPPQGPYSPEGEALSAGELARYPFILREEGSGTLKETEDYLRAHGTGLSALNVVARMEEPDAIKNAVSQGLGISIVSRMAVSDFVRLGLVRAIPLEGDGIRRKLYIVCHKSRPLSNAASAFLSFALEKFKT